MSEVTDTVEYSREMEEAFQRAKIFLSYPWKIDGVIKIGTILRLKKGIEAEPWATMEKGSFCSMGAFSYTRSKLQSNVRIGRYCSIATDVEILGTEHPVDFISSHVFTFRSYYRDVVAEEFGGAPDVKPFRADRGPVTIGNDVWICQGVKIRPGVKIGDGSVIASGAIVVNDVPPFTIVGGTPAKVIRPRFEKALQDRIFEDPWWQYHMADFSGLDVSNPIAFLDGLDRKQSKRRYAPAKIDVASLLRNPSSIGIVDASQTVSQEV